MLEIFTALVFVVLLIMMVLLFLRPTSTSTVTTTTTSVIVTNSYNENSYNDYENDFNDRYSNRDRFGRYDDRVYDRDRYGDRKGDYLRYDHRSRHRVAEDIVGKKVDQYIVYVKNREYEGGYFTVRFYLYDGTGVRDIAVMTKYVGPRDEKAFVYRDVDYSYRYHRWDYKIISESKISYRNDYDDRSYRY